MTEARQRGSVKTFRPGHPRSCYGKFLMFCSVSANHSLHFNAFHWYMVFNGIFVQIQFNRANLAKAEWKEGSIHTVEKVTRGKPL
jgi:hypothetical protein